MGCNSSKSTAVEGDQQPKTASADEEAPEDGVTPGEEAANTNSTDPNQNASWDDWTPLLLHCAYIISFIVIRTEELTIKAEEYVIQYHILNNIYMCGYQIVEYKRFLRLLQQ